jgi:VanZ family protein
VFPRLTQPIGGDTAGAGRSRVATAAWAGLLVALLLFLWFGDEPEYTLLWDALFDAGHALLFGVAAIAILGILGGWSSPTDLPRTWWLALGLAVALGAATEILQFLQPSRDPSLVDFLRDSAGAGASLLIAAVGRAVWRGQGLVRSRAGRVKALALAAILLAAAGAHLAATVALYAARDRACPTLFALDGSWWERRLIHENGSVLTPRARPAGAGASCPEPLARLDLAPGRYPGVTFDEPYPDWTGYHRLAFTVVSDLGDALSLTIRVHDAFHDQRFQDRFNRSFVIHPGVNRIEIPLDEIRRAPDRREMDMRRIRGIILFGYRLGAPTHVYLGAIGLE